MALASLGRPVKQTLPLFPTPDPGLYAGFVGCAIPYSEARPRRRIPDKSACPGRPADLTLAGMRRANQMTCQCSTRQPWLRDMKRWRCSSAVVTVTSPTAWVLGCCMQADRRACSGQISRPRLRYRRKRPRYGATAISANHHRPDRQPRCPFRGQINQSGRKREFRETAIAVVEEQRIRYQAPPKHRTVEIVDWRATYKQIEIPVVVDIQKLCAPGDGHVLPRRTPQTRYSLRLPGQIRALDAGGTGNILKTRARDANGSSKRVWPDVGHGGVRYAIAINVSVANPMAFSPCPFRPESAQNQTPPNDQKSATGARPHPVRPDRRSTTIR